MFVIDPSLPINPGDLDEGADRWEKQQRLQEFKDRIARDQKASPFEDATLGPKVLQALQQWRERKAKTPPKPKAPPIPCAPRQPTGDFDKEITDYRKKAASFYAHLPMAGFARRLKAPVNLEEIYVPLRAMLDLSGEEQEYADSAHAEERLAHGSRQTDIALPDAFRESEKLGRHGLIILGDPGSGKTTHLLRLLLWCIREGHEQVALPSEMVPVFLPLRNLTDLSQGLDRFIEDELARPHFSTADGFGRRLLDRGNLLFLLDGLDEIADEAQRIEVSKWIGSAVRTHGDCRLVVTCRYAGYTPDAALNEHFLETHIRPMTAGQADNFVRNWYRIVERGLTTDPEQARIMATERADDLIQCLRTPDFRARRVFELTRNPLLLTNICLVHRHRNRLPQKRARLYEDCIDVLLEHWREAKKLELGIDARSGRRVLQPVAAWLHGREGRTRATAEELAPVIEPALDAIEWKSGANNFLERIRNDCGLLTGLDHKHFGFMHLGFQEYLAAREIRSRAFDQPEVLSELASHFGESWWQEVGLLLLSLEDPSLFVAYMREVVKLPNFAEHPSLVEACLDDAAEVSSLPFVELLEQTPGRRREFWKRQLLALSILERIDPQSLEKMAETLRSHPSAEIRNRFISREDEKIREILEAERGGYELVPIPGGTFMMGSPESENGRYSWEGPQHEVTISPFAIGRYPVTNEEYAVFLKANPGIEEPEYWGDRNYNQARQPVVGVSWEDARQYADWAGLRLPTEAEWEYACRAGADSAFNDGSDCTKPDGKDPALDKLGWYDENSGDTLRPVGEKESNSWGLYDMHGNVWEWCLDGLRGYTAEPQQDPCGPDESARRVVRGGSFLHNARNCRSACRNAFEPGYRYQILGFRLAAGQQTGSGAVVPAAEGAAAPGSREATSADGPAAERSLE
jgi:formylglycine-generating enzyme required for sulfatase activity